MGRGERRRVNETRMEISRSSGTAHRERKGPGRVSSIGSLAPPTEDMVGFGGEWRGCYVKSLWGQFPRLLPPISFISVTPREMNEYTCRVAPNLGSAGQLCPCSTAARTIQSTTHSIQPYCPTSGYGTHMPSRTRTTHRIKITAT